MALIAGPGDMDTASTGLGPVCVYPGQPLGGPPYISSDVVIEGQPAKFFSATSPPTPIPQPPASPTSPPGVCQIGTRVVIPRVNNTVRINGQYPAVGGDRTDIVGTQPVRTIVVGTQYPTVILNTTNFVNNP